MKYKVKKQWAGRVSVRSYIVDYCRKMREPLMLEFDQKLIDDVYLKVKEWRAFMNNLSL